MLSMASPKQMMIVPPQEREDTQENSIEPPGTENRIVNQLVEAIDQKMPEVPINKN